LLFYKLFLLSLNKNTEGENTYEPPLSLKPDEICAAVVVATA